MNPRKMDLGPTGATVATNIQRLREGQNLTYAELSRRLEEVGNPIPALGLRRIEASERRVHVDDLVALAHILGTSPVNLLMPDTPTGDDEVTATGLCTTTARNLWKWMRDATYQRAERQYVIPQYMGPEWVMHETTPEGEAALKEFRRRLDALGIRAIDTPESTTDGDD